MDLQLKISCNLLNTLLKHKYEVLSVTLKLVGTISTVKFLPKKAHTNFYNSHIYMDKVSERRIIESMRNTILKHEEIFKQQVLELHQLYQVQKMLTTELKGEKVRMKTSVGTSNHQTDTINKIQGSRSSSETTHSSHASDINNSNVVLNSSSPEFINCSRLLRTSRGFASQQHIEEESIESCSNKECNLDLSLGISCASEKMRSEDRKEIMKGSMQFLSSNSIREESGKECTNSSGGFGAESFKRPQWLFQALSLNRT